MQKILLWIQLMYLSISFFMIDSQEGQVAGLVQLARNAIFPWLDSHDYGAICTGSYLYYI